MAKSDRSAPKAPKASGKNDTKGAKKAGKPGAGPTKVSVSAHPRAAAAIRRAKGFGGVGSFAVTAYLSHQAGVPPAQIALRALAIGVVGYLVAWACAVSIWRQLVLAELSVAEERYHAEREAREAAHRASLIPADAAGADPEPEPATAGAGA